MLQEADEQKRSWKSLYFLEMEENKLAADEARAQLPPCPWSANACAEAAAHGHLPALQWLRSQEPPCSWDAQTLLRAAAGGHAHVLAWAVQQGC